jgi:hypothetical protein
LRMMHAHRLSSSHASLPQKSRLGKGEEGHRLQRCFQIPTSTFAECAAGVLKLPLILPMERAFWAVLL